MKVLHVGDDQLDAVRIERALGQLGAAVALSRVETPADLQAALAGADWDLVVAAEEAASLGTSVALAALRDSGKDVPLVVLSGRPGGGDAASAMRAGARDVVAAADLGRLAAVAEREVRDAAARRLDAERHVLERELLDRLNGVGDLPAIARAVLERVLRHAGADAGGIRLEHRGDFPYFSHAGFDEGFLETEGSLLGRGSRGRRACTVHGDRALDCLCGAVLQRSPAVAALVTRRGTFVTGRLGQACGSAGAAAAVPSLRGRCGQEGFESLLLLPIPRGDAVAGLLQLCARAPDRFAPDLVEFLERLAPSLGLALARRAYQESLAASEDRYRVLARRLQGAREEERIRIARDLHDDLGQSLTRLQLDLRGIEARVDELPRSVEVGRLNDEVVSAAELARALVGDVQRIAKELRPMALEGEDLPLVLAQEVRQWAHRAGLAARFDGGGSPSISDAAAMALYRIAQEALSNVARHAGASAVTVRLAQEAGEVTLTVEDDGCGFRSARVEDAGSLGLLGMRERARAVGGDVEFGAAPDRGARVRAWVPRRGASP